MWVGYSAQGWVPAVEVVGELLVENPGADPVWQVYRQQRVVAVSQVGAGVGCRERQWLTRSERATPSCSTRTKTRIRIADQSSPFQHPSSDSPMPVENNTDTTDLLV